MTSRRNRPPPPPIIDSEAGPGPVTEEREQQSSNSTRGTKCELKQLDGRYDHLGNYSITDSAVSTVGSEDDTDAHAEFALVSTRVYGMDGLYQSTQLEIKSKLVKRALRKVIKFYPGQPVDTAELILNDPPKPLFHYRKELDDYKHAKADDETKKHLDLLFKFVDSLLKPSVDRFKDYTKRGLIRFPLVWMLFKPGEIVYTEKDGEPVCFMLNQVDAARGLFERSWKLTCIGTQYDGERFGKANDVLKIGQFEGTREITSLNVFPLKWHPDANKVKQRLLERGKRFISLQGTHHMQYKEAGMAHVLTGKTKNSYDSEDEGMEGEQLFQSSLVTGRIMVDCKTFGRINSGNRIRFQSNAGACGCSSCRLQASPSADSQDPESNLPARGVPASDPAKGHDHEVVLSDKDTLLCPPFVLGFSLQSKKWCRFSIDRVQDVHLNTKAFDQLLINENHKQLVLAMVESHVENDDSIDDIIQGKGKSLIMLLHGAPGVGKTLTAESIADHTERPLYTISSGELGTHPTQVEEHLTHVLDIATQWKAVVLLDEADVFLQQRNESDINRNALVSVFLRILEYFEGILFLTSNRVESFDLAFKSRIHVALHYPELTLAVRRQLWKDFLLRMPEEQRHLDLDRDLDTLQIEVINGRQIKNACKTAAALARKRGEKLQIKHLETTLSTIREFEKDFAKGSNLVNGCT
ncbi:MAG: hypothetical protein M4579_003932 [Chaenotheca gracillima]|nr:MAG: hypothetical protein M4579_003932 [Chaenotheca gracillima]